MIGTSVTASTRNRQGMYARRDDVATLFIFFGIAFKPVLIGTGFQPDVWYESLNKPFWETPRSLFGPVWAVLYTLIGYSGYLAWSSSSGRVRQSAFWIYPAQLILNALWTPLFFGLSNPGLSLVNISAQWLIILLNIIAFYRIKPAAGILLIPYFLWVTFALLLNGTIWSLNR